MEAYYYSRLNKLQKTVYQAMKQGFENCASAIVVQKLEPNELSDIFFLLRLDHPLLFYVDTFQYRTVPQADTVEILPKYLFEKKKIAEHRQAVQTRLRRLTEPLKEKTESERLLAIHDFICTGVHYDKLKKAYSHEIIGPLTQGVGVCEGIAKSVKALCDELGIWCIIAVADSNAEKGIRYRHAWNVVHTEGVYTHLDATFDLNLSKNDIIRRDYVNLSDKQIFRDHEPVIWQVPVCESADRFYYRKKKLSFTKNEDLEKRAAQFVKKDRPFVFHWRGGYLTKDVLNEILFLLDSCGTSKGRHALVSLNYPQAVFCVRYVEACACTISRENADAEEQD